MPKRVIEGVYDDVTYELIEQLNFENWIHFNKKIVKLLYDNPTTNSELKSAMEEGDYFLNALKRGIEYGVLWRRILWRRANCHSKYHLTEEAMMYYKDHMEDSDI